MVLQAWVVSEAAGLLHTILTMKTDGNRHNYSVFCNFFGLKMNSLSKLFFAFVLHNLHLFFTISADHSIKKIYVYLQILIKVHHQVQHQFQAVVSVQSYERGQYQTPSAPNCFGMYNYPHYA